MEQKLIDILSTIERQLFDTQLKLNELRALLEQQDAAGADVAAEPDSFSSGSEEILGEAAETELSAPAEEAIPDIVAGSGSFAPASEEILGEAVETELSAPAGDEPVSVEEEAAPDPVDIGVDFGDMPAPPFELEPETVPGPEPMPEAVPEAEPEEPVALEVPEVAVAVPQPETVIREPKPEKKIAGYSWEVDIPGNKVANVISAVSLNDRVLFINTLFGEDPIKFNEAVAKFNSMQDFEEAKQYVFDNYKDWNFSSEVVYRLMMAVRRRLQ